MYKLLILTLLLLTSCYEYEGNDAEPKLVVEGWIESDGFPVVILTMTAAPEIAEDINLADYIAKYAKVTISDGDTTVILTGMMDKKYYPPLVFKSFDMRGKVGKEYYLTAEYRGLTVTAKTKILEPYDLYEITPVVTGDTTRILDAEVQHEIPGGEKIMFFSRVWNEETRFYPALLGIYEVEPNKNVYSIYHKKKATDYNVGDSIVVKLCHIDDFQFNFWQAYFNAVNFGGGFVISTDKSLPSNIEGGYGYFFGYGVSSKSVILNN
ncbi:MAG: DUF4249 family protein [Bacteroidales bacterium]|nr:DUF4249 family protein [Bacteroidales bacterium]